MIRISLSILLTLKVAVSFCQEHDHLEEPGKRAKMDTSQFVLGEWRLDSVFGDTQHWKKRSFHLIQTGGMDLLADGTVM